VIITVSLRGIGHGVGRRRTEVYAVSLGDEGSSGHLGARSLCVVLDSRCSSCVSFLNAPGRSWAAPRCALRLARGARSAAVLPSSRLTSARPRSVPPLFVSFAGAHQLRWCTSQADCRIVAYLADEVTRDLAARHSSFSLAAPARGSRNSLNPFHTPLGFRRRPAGWDTRSRLGGRCRGGRVLVNQHSGLSSGTVGYYRSHQWYRSSRCKQQAHQVNDREGSIRRRVNEEEHSPR
jgi:hypothetical protein